MSDKAGIRRERFVDEDWSHWQFLPTGKGPARPRPDTDTEDKEQESKDE